MSAAKTISQRPGLSNPSSSGLPGGEIDPEASNTSNGQVKEAFAPPGRLPKEPCSAKPPPTSYKAKQAWNRLMSTLADTAAFLKKRGLPAMTTLQQLGSSNSSSSGLPSEQIDLKAGDTSGGQPEEDLALPGRLPKEPCFAKPAPPTYKAKKALKKLLAALAATVAFFKTQGLLPTTTPQQPGFLAPSGALESQVNELGGGLGGENAPGL